MVRDGYIDFLKGVCIVWVVFTHNLPQHLMDSLGFIVWGQMAVPLFLLLQCYHVFRKGFSTPDIKWSSFYNAKKTLHRIILPFIYTTVCSGILLIISGKPVLNVIKSAVVQGGIGPGSYYFWIYVQFLVIVPPIFFLVKRWGGWKLHLVFIAVAQLLEILCMVSGIGEPLYRLLCFRYVFLIYLGFLWSQTMISKKLEKWQVIFAIVSLIALIFIHYVIDGSLNPIFHDTAWRDFHWICYYWAAFLLPWLLRYVYNKCHRKLQKAIEYIGRYSYEIFLMQMFVFTAYPIIFGGANLHGVFVILITTVASILPVLLYQTIKNKHALKES